MKRRTKVQAPVEGSNQGTLWIENVFLNLDVSQSDYPRNLLHFTINCVIAT